MARRRQRTDDTADGAVDPFAEHLWPRPPHPLLRRLDPRRFRQRRHTRRAVRYAHYGPPISEGPAADFRSITFWHRDQHSGPVGKLNYLICHQCRIGFIGDIHVQKNLWGHGIATRALAYLRDQLPGYAWQTSRHKPTAKSFWLLTAERTGAAYADTTPDRTCEHLARFWRGGATRHRSASDETPAWVADIAVTNPQAASPTHPGAPTDN
ncbi:hypothetical protein [Nocardia blacklockiae]|uniref:hypothetical protein n=1 Tax=Nocardia blacklockiae TaxID=480036 RepID=UPI001894B38A|nr:hypothetical protein [Nocardia blacklockiae]